jgi:hypothetical protein
MSEADVTRDALDEFYKGLYKRERNTGRAGNGNRPWSKPLASEALAVNPKQIKEAVEDARVKGVPTDFDGAGRPLFRDRKHRRQYMQVYGFYDRDGGYGDAQRGTTRGQDKEPDIPDYRHLDEAAAPPGVEVRKEGVRYFIANG